MKVLSIRLLEGICLVTCLPIGMAFLANVYGLATMRGVILTIALPCCAALAGIWIWAGASGKKELTGKLAVGFLGGLLGTFAYDLFRVPFEIVGYRLFAPISAYGVWIGGADFSSRYTNVIGWVYHFASGISFGMIYALCMAGRHWAWAILWGLLLETGAILSPFARIFSLSGNLPLITIAYLGHVAYGVVLGLIVSHWNEAQNWLITVPAGFKWAALALAGAALVIGPVLSPEAVSRDAKVVKGEFRAEGGRLFPTWQRIKGGEKIRVLNPGPASAILHIKPEQEVSEIPGQQTQIFLFPQPGVHQLYIKTDRQSRSSFVIVEPVAETP